MPAAITSPTTNKAGLCPHGLPPAACPICSGGAGMSAASRVRDTAPVKSMQSDEWSFLKCYAAGLAMKTQAARAENSKNVFEKQIEFAQQLSKSIQNLADKIKTVMNNIQNTMPVFISAPLAAVVNTVLAVISKIPNLIINVTNMLQQACEKLTALLGEIKNFISKKIVDNIKKQAKKFFMFFISNIEDENYQNDDTLSVFKSRELRKFLIKILKRDKNADSGING